jgi:hypothetical protein
MKSMLPFVAGRSFLVPCAAVAAFVVTYSLPVVVSSSALIATVVAFITGLLASGTQ